MDSLSNSIQQYERFPTQTLVDEIEFLERLTQKHPNSLDNERLAVIKKIVSARKDGLEEKTN